MKVFLIVAISVDGFIARDSDQISTSWTSAEDKQFFRERTKQAGVIVMGRKTFETIGRPLPGRVNIVLSRESQRCNVATLQQGEVGYTSSSPTELIQELEHAGFNEVAICGGQQIYTAFLEAGLVDTLYLTIEPVIFGSGVKFVGNNHGCSVQLKEIKKLNEQGTLLLEYESTH